MPKLQIELDAATTEALSSLANSRGTTAGDLAGEIVERYVQHGGLAANGRTLTPPSVVADTVNLNDDADRPRRPVSPPDPLDALVGSIDADPVDDIDEVIYGR